MQEIRVETMALEAAAGRILSASDAADRGRAAMSRVGGGAFGGEPIARSFEGMQERALSSATAIVDVTRQLAESTQAAVYGYIVTDEGAIPSERWYHHRSEIPKLP